MSNNNNNKHSIGDDNNNNEENLIDNQPQKNNENVIYNESNIPNQFVWDSTNCGKLLKIINPTTVKNNTKVVWIGVYVTGTIEFKKNSGIYSWQLKVTQLNDSLNVLGGVSQLNDLSFDDYEVCKKMYGALTEGYIYKGDGNLHNTSIPHTVGCFTDMMIDLELNTYSNELKCCLYNLEGTKRYLFEIIPDIPFPCYPSVLIVTNNTTVELLNFKSNKKL
eukprot:TRINITY_DN15747_c0_g1_i1.p1 TRINITY_DN15747_c0_g1~~TRINITY_DN15747_c0_g1_i1.p1  ORF type:complete len:220 (+),score=58.95 TRINITY_DN15747_c0_g1_i1:109-768(+)